ncbi:hypothetical protein ACFVXQ_27125, partial [Kitasatospora sp. NPDC058263]
ASIMIRAEVPLAVVAKSLRHSTQSTTVNISGHLLPRAAQGAGIALCQAPEDASPPPTIPDGGASESPKAA